MERTQACLDFIREKISPIKRKSSGESLLGPLECTQKFFDISRQYKALSCERRKIVFDGLILNEEGVFEGSEIKPLRRKLFRDTDEPLCKEKKCMDTGKKHFELESFEEAWNIATVLKSDKVGKTSGRLCKVSSEQGICAKIPDVEGNPYETPIEKVMRRIDEGLDDQAKLESSGTRQCNEIEVSPKVNNDPGYEKVPKIVSNECVVTTIIDSKEIAKIPKLCKDLKIPVVQEVASVVEIGNSQEVKTCQDITKDLSDCSVGAVVEISHVSPKQFEVEKVVEVVIETSKELNDLIEVVPEHPSVCESGNNSSAAQTTPKSDGIEVSVIKGVAQQVRINHSSDKVAANESRKLFSYSSGKDQEAEGDCNQYSRKCNDVLQTTCFEADQALQGFVNFNSFILLGHNFTKLLFSALSFSFITTQNCLGFF